MDLVGMHLYMKQTLFIGSNYMREILVKIKNKLSKIITKIEKKLETEKHEIDNNFFKDGLYK